MRSIIKAQTQKMKNLPGAFPLCWI